MLRLLLAGLLVMLTACTTVQTIFPVPPDQSLWQHHLTQVAALEQWNIQGRVSIQTEHNGGQADLFWNQQDRQNYDIKLIAPFGAGTSYLQARPQGVMLTTSDGQQMGESSVDVLMNNLPDWHFPVSGLRYWMLGMPSPGSDYQLMDWNAGGYLQLMQQDGWRVEMREYRAEGDYYLPRKLFISRSNYDEEVDVRLVIRQWGLSND